MNVKNGTIGEVLISPGESAPNRVLVKFHFTNKKHVPAGIRWIDRPTDQTVDDVHAQQAVAAGLFDQGTVGRVRPGRVDTGRHVVDNCPDVQLAVLRRGLTNVGFRLEDVHAFEKLADPRNKPKVIVVLTFVRNDNGVELTRPTLEALRGLGRSTWQYCHVWDNPNGVVTINLVGRRWDDKNQCYLPPRHALVVRDWKLQVKSVTEEVAESQE